LHDRGMTEARLYGANANDGVGGTGSVFLLLDEPEVYGLPPDPQVSTKFLPQMFAKVGIAAAGMATVAALSFLGGRGGAPPPSAPIARPSRRAAGEAARAGGVGPGTPSVPVAGTGPARRSWSATSSPTPTTAARWSRPRPGAARSRPTSSWAASPAVAGCSPWARS